MRFHPGTLASILPRLRIWSEVTELDVDPCRPRGPVDTFPSELKHQEVPADLLADDGARTVRKNELLVQLDDRGKLLVLARDESDDAPEVAPLSPGGCQPGRLEPIRASDEDPVANG